MEFMTGFLQRKLSTCQLHRKISFQHNSYFKSWGRKAALPTCPKWVNVNFYFITVIKQKLNLELSPSQSAWIEFSCFEPVKGTSDSSKALKKNLLINGNRLLEMLMSSPTTIAIMTLHLWFHQDMDQYQEIRGSHQHWDTRSSGHPHIIWGSMCQWHQTLPQQSPYLMLFPLATSNLKLYQLIHKWTPGRTLDTRWWCFYQIAWTNRNWFHIYSCDGCPARSWNCDRKMEIDAIVNHSWNPWKH